MNPTPFVTLLAALVIGVLVPAALLHIYWALGGRTGKLAAVPEIEGQRAFKPSAAATLAVALALLLAALVVAASAGMIRGLLPGPVLTLLNYSLALVFLGRAVGNFRTVGFFKNLHRTRFARLDSIAYSPICLLLGAAILGIALVPT